MSTALSTRFSNAWRAAKLKGDATPYFERLAEAYNESARAYHNLIHIAHMLDEFDAQIALAESPHAIEFAIWFHDAVYDSRAKDNEERSATWAREVLLSGGADENFCRVVSTLILATRHQHPPQFRDEQLLVDCDLAILGQSPERFDAYETAIRKEYEWVTDTDYRTGRARVLEHFLARPNIYSLPPFHALYEINARENLKLSLHRLSSEDLSRK